MINKPTFQELHCADNNEHIYLAHTHTLRQLWATKCIKFISSDLDLSPAGISGTLSFSQCTKSMENSLKYKDSNSFYRVLKYIHTVDQTSAKMLCRLKDRRANTIFFFCLTPNTPLIQLWCAQSKLNMDKICSLNIHLWYVDIPQKVLLKSLHAQKRSFLLLNL